MQQLTMFTNQFVVPDEDSDSWYTPRPIIEAARLTMGGIDLDPASSRKANERVRASKYYTVAEDGLSQRWYGRVWLNFPYSNPLPWVQQLKDTYRHSDHIDQFIVLAPERIGVKWFNIMLDISDAMCIFAERIRFDRADQRGTSSPNFGNVAFYAGHRALMFRQYFAPFGHVTRTGWD
jgi:ParB family chromosome partitioning protein